MGYFGCEYCGKANGLFDEHECDPQKIKSEIDRLKSELLNTRSSRDNAQSSILSFVRELSTEMISNQTQVLVQKKLIERLVSDAKYLPTDEHGNTQIYENGSFCSPAHRIACEDCAYSGLLCDAFRIFREKISNLDELQEKLNNLYESCLEAQETFGYQDSKLEKLDVVSLNYR